jgi:hypothetical protein
MPPSTALLMTRDLSLTGAVREALAAVAGLHLHAVSTPAELLGQLLGGAITVRVVEGRARRLRLGSASLTLEVRREWRSFAPRPGPSAATGAMASLPRRVGRISDYAKPSRSAGVKSGIPGLHSRRGIDRMPWPDLPGSRNVAAGPLLSLSPDCTCRPPPSDGLVGDATPSGSSSPRPGLT